GVEREPAKIQRRPQGRGVGCAVPQVAEGLFLRPLRKSVKGSCRSSNQAPRKTVQLGRAIEDFTPMTFHARSSDPAALLDFPYASQRMPLLAANVVSTSQPLAASAGLRMLARGGNAVDAALATA